MLAACSERLRAEVIFCSHECAGAEAGAHKIKRCVDRGATSIQGRAPYELIRAVRVRGKQSEFVDTKVSKILTYIVHNEQRCSHASLVTKEHFRNTIRNTDGVQVELRRFPARVEHDKQLPLLLSAFMQRLIICRHESYTHPETFSIEDTSR